LELKSRPSADRGRPFVIGLLAYADAFASTITVAIAVMKDAAFFACAFDVTSFVVRLTTVKTVAFDCPIQLTFLLLNVSVACVFAVTAICSRSPSAPKHHQGAQRDH
jgi:hypothetical protein